MNFHSAAERLRYLLRERGITQTQLAQKLKVSNQIISMLCAEKRENSKLWPEIAKYFGIELNWLMHGTTNNEQDLMLIEATVYSRFYKIPLFDTLGSNILKNMRIDLETETEHFELTRDHEHQYLFAMGTTNNALKFKFGNNTILLFHTQLEPVIGDFVVAYLPQKELFIYRDIGIKNERLTFLPIDSDLYKELYIDEINPIIMAVLYEKRIKRVTSSNEILTHNLKLSHLLENS